MNIIILEGHAVNPGDLSFECFNDLGNIKVYDRTTDTEVQERIKNADAIIVNKACISKNIITASPNLKYIGEMATGYNNIDIEAAKNRGIVVTNVPHYSTQAVAQHVFALLLEKTNQVGLHNASVHAGEWSSNADFCYWKMSLEELANKTFGILGYGNIGRQVAKIATAFGMKVIVHTRTMNDSNVNYVSLEDLFSYSDILSLHVPFSDRTRNIVSKKMLDIAKENLIIINTARGGLVNEADLALALNNGHIQGYLTDVVTKEPIDKNSPLLTAKNCIITPHLAWAPLETRKRCMHIAMENLRAFIANKPKNVI